MKKFLLTAVLSLALLEMPAWGVWYSVDDYPFEQDSDRGTVTFKNKNIDIYFQTTEGSKLFKGTDVDDQVIEIEELLKGKNTVDFSINFIKPSNNEHLDLMEATLNKFELNYENIHCKKAVPEIQTAWEALYQKTKRQIDKEIEEDQEKSRRHEQRREDLQESNPGAGISDSSDSEKLESSEKADEGSDY